MDETSIVRVHSHLHTQSMRLTGNPIHVAWVKPRFVSVVDQLLTPVSLVTADGSLLYSNHAAATTLGLGRKWLGGRQILDFVHPDDRTRVRQELRRVANGKPPSLLTRYRIRNEVSNQWRVLESSAVNFLGHPDIEGIVLSSRDLTDELAYQNQLYHAANHDSLTGLPNRANFEGQLEVAIQGSEAISVAFLGIDRFAMIVDSLGPCVGDTVLRTLAARTCSTVPLSVVVGQLSHDGLALLFQGSDAGGAEQCLRQCIASASEPMVIPGHELLIHVSAGVAQRRPNSTAESMLREAGLALSLAKGGGGARVEKASAEMLDAAVARVDLESKIRHAIERTEFSLALQPIVRLADGSPVKSEALVRWRTEGTTRMPGDFIEVAEETGLIIPLGDWIIERAMHIASASPGHRIMVNLSARQLLDPGLPDRIGRLLEAQDLGPSAMGFEVTESLLIQNFDVAVAALSEIRKLGCKIGLDDFGTGYSSLSYLRRLPIDFLKIDRSLTADIDSDEQVRHINGAIISMASALGQEVVAEGIETERQARVLGDLGCGFAQGYLFGRPV